MKNTNALCYTLTPWNNKTGQDLEHWGLEGLDSESSTISGFHHDKTNERKHFLETRRMSTLELGSNISCK